MEITSKSRWNTWETIDWKVVEHQVFKLAKRIYRASLQGEVKLARAMTPFTEIKIDATN